MAFLDVLGVLASPLVNLASSIFTNKTNKENVEATNATNLQQTQETNAANKEIHSADNAFNASEAQKAREWNTLENQVLRAQQAGFSPFSVLEGNQTSQVAATSAAPPAMQAAQAMPFAAAAPQLQDPFNAIKALADARKAGAESNRLNKLLGIELRQGEAGARLTESQATAQEIANGFENTFGYLRRDTEIKQMFANIKTATEQAKALAAAGELDKANTALAHLKQSTERQLARLEGYKGDIAKRELDTYMTRLNAELDNIRADSESKRATAAKTNEETSQLRDMHEFIVDEKRYASQLTHAELKEKAATLDSRIDYLLGYYDRLSQSEQADLDRLKALAGISEHEYNTRWYHEILNLLERVSNAVAAFVPFAPDRETSTSISSVDRYDDGSFVRTDSRTVEKGKKFKK